MDAFEARAANDRYNEKQDFENCIKTVTSIVREIKTPGSVLNVKINQKIDQFGNNHSFEISPRDFPNNYDELLEALSKCTIKYEKRMEEELRLASKYLLVRNSTCCEGYTCQKCPGLSVFYHQR